MEIVLSQDGYWSLFQECTANEQMVSSSDQLDIAWMYPSWLGHGSVREICLREGLTLTIANYQLHSDILLHSCDREHPLEYVFTLPERYSNLTDTIPYHFFGSGIAPGERGKQYANQQITWVSVHIEPEVFRSFTGNPDGEVPETLQHLIGDPNHKYYVCPGQANPAMQIALRQILHCPYQGFTRRIFLESKVLELLSLLLGEEVERHSDKPLFANLKPDDVDRVHYAKEILLQNLINPPSLPELARQVGLNECTLKRGFRQVFGTTAFGYLYNHRLEEARQLLLERRLNVSEVAHALGFSNCSHLSRAFRQRYGVSPKQYQARRKNSV